MDILEKQGFLIDIDGTVLRGDQLIPGAAEAIKSLQEQGKKVVFLSNRGNISRKTCLEKMRRLGIEVDKEDILLSSYVASTFLKAHFPHAKIWVLGDHGLREELLETRLIMAEAPTEADWLVVTLHEHLTYEDLNNAFRAVKSGARILATNADKSFPREDGEAIDVGGMLGAIEATTNHRVDIVVGKPSHIMVNTALDHLGLTADQCVMIGDSLGSDISMGKLFGFQTVLVLSGGTTKKDLDNSPIQPDVVLDSIARLVQ